MRVSEIETAVTELPAPELTLFRPYFTEFDNYVWGAQMEAGAAAGKLDALAAEALAEYHAGKDLPPVSQSL